MTALTKPVSRLTNRRISGREIIVTLAPSGSQNEALIGFRLKGRRTQYVSALSDCYRIAAMNHGLKEKRAKSAARKAGIPWRVAKKDFIRANTI